MPGLAHRKPSKPPQNNRTDFRGLEGNVSMRLRRLLCGKAWPFRDASALNPFGSGGKAEPSRRSREGGMRQAQPESQRLSAQQAAEPQPAWMGWPRCNWSAPTTPSSPGACPLSSHFDAHPVHMRVESP
jgi:hypothetical protein